MNQTHFEELIELYALDLLDDTEKKQVEAYLVTSPTARAKLIELRETAAALAFSVTPVTPAPNVRDRLLQQVQQAGTSVQPQPRAPAPPEAQVVAFQRPAVQTSNPKPQTPGAIRWFALAASLAVVGLGGGLWLTWERVQTLQTQLTATQSQLLKETLELEKTKQKADWLASPEARNAALGGTPVSPAARAKLTFDPQTGQAVFTVQNLPPLPSGKAYQLWFIADGKPIPGLVFTIDKQGRLEFQENIPTQGRKASIFAVTLEPAGGSTAPTGDMVLKTPAL
ncbi:MAG: anti-sigma factor [Blastocatellia bacterium]|nr:anti-sigma factor [Blastocatellia bacterium]